MVSPITPINSYFGRNVPRLIGSNTPRSKYEFDPNWGLPFVNFSSIPFCKRLHATSEVGIKAVIPVLNPLYRFSELTKHVTAHHSTTFPSDALLPAAFPGNGDPGQWPSGSETDSNWNSNWFQTGSPVEFQFGQFANRFFPIRT